jgi:transcriptional regulator with XRE-family HTH domain
MCDILTDQVNDLICVCALLAGVADRDCPAMVGDTAIGARLRALRERAGLTQLALAEAADVADATISRIERGRIKAPSMEFAEKIAGALKIPVNELFEPTEKPPPEALRPSERRLLALVRDLDDAEVDDVARALKLMLGVGR